MTSAKSHTRAATDPDDVPSDDTPFDATTAIPGYDEGWWPPAVWGLMHDELPLNIRNQYAEITVTTLEGTFATIPAERKDEVLAALEEQEQLGERRVEVAVVA